MISYAEAIEIINKTNIKPKIEKIDFLDSLGRILAQDVKSDIDTPPFDKSAMDGYAYKSKDSKNKLKVIEHIQAGIRPEKAIKDNECSKIMTGAMIPVGADAVAMVEKTSTKDGFVEIIEADIKNNILRKAEDVKKNEVVLQKGIKIRAQEVAILATFGQTKVKVFQKPLVGIISTGTEIIEPYKKPKLGQIRNSNGYMLISKIKELGANYKYYGIVEDEPSKLEETLDLAIKECDMILFTGGVSMGDFDFLPVIFKKKKVKLFFEKLAIQPGKPTVFGKKADLLIFGLPGNPVSAFVTFSLFTKPLLRKMMGYENSDYLITAKLTKEIKRKRDERLLFHPVRFVGKNLIEPVEYHGSGHLHSLCNAHGLVEIPIGVKQIKKGTSLDVRQI
ncbi:MAG: gephyrin-like molybdotransferase Glp [Pseudomonadota bacterium]